MTGVQTCALPISPHGLRSGIIERIEREAASAKAGRPSGVRIKANSLVDEQVIDALYRASMVGVPIECVVRGICALRPGVPGLSETVRVRSILGRYLEHSRVFEFIGGDETWIGSGDMMHRNLDRRVETLVRIQDTAVRQQVRTVLDLAMSPRVRAWELRSDGTWSRPSRQAGDPGGTLVDMQTTLLSRSAERAESG